MDVLWNLQYLLPSPKFGGCVEHNTQEEYEALRWEDERPKPTWEELSAVVVPPTTQQILDTIEGIITQGQNAMAEAPLPEAIQKQIFDLEVFVQNYVKRKAYQLAVDTINGFVIPDGTPGVTDGQRVQVDTLKGLLLAVFNAV